MHQRDVVFAAHRALAPRPSLAAGVSWRSAGRGVADRVKRFDDVGRIGCSRSTPDTVQRGHRQTGECRNRARCQSRPAAWRATCEQLQRSIERVRYVVNITEPCGVPSWHHFSTHRAAGGRDLSLVLPFVAAVLLGRATGSGGACASAERRRRTPLTRRPFVDDPGCGGQAFSSRAAWS
jgi:hypothetical protein